MTYGRARITIARKVASVLPPRPDMTENELIVLADSVIGVGMRLAGIIHDEDPSEAGSLVAGLSPDRAWALPFVMAAMLDTGKTAREMLEWADFAVPNNLAGATCVAPASLLLRSRPRPTKLVECGTEAAWQRHRSRREEPDDACWKAHRGFEADKKQAQRDARRGRPPARQQPLPLPGLAKERSDAAA